MLGGLKGPIMKVAQLMATIPDVLPPEYRILVAALLSIALGAILAYAKRKNIQKN